MPKIFKVARVGSGDSDDPFGSLLEALGLQASSVEFYRRHAVARQYLWNSLIFRQGRLPHGNSPIDIAIRARMLAERALLIQNLNSKARSFATEAGVSTEELPKIFRLTFFEDADEILDPVVDDIPREETEKLSETQPVKAHYPNPRTEELDQSPKVNYIGWLGNSPYLAIRDLDFAEAVPGGERFPRALLYRMLRTSLLQALYDAALRLYMDKKKGPFESTQNTTAAVSVEQLEQFSVLHREIQLINIRPETGPQRPMTRWEYLNNDIKNVLGQEHPSMTVGEYLLSDAGLQLEGSSWLRETLASIRALELLSTAQLERVFAEHIDVCSYRLDAWQTGFFNRRLQQERFPPPAELDAPPQNNSTYRKPAQGLYLGAFGWLEDLRPAAPMVTADLNSVPISLHNPNQDDPLYEQPENKGFIHGPSLNHAVTAAILRSSYLNHFDPDHPGTMAVNLSSERVRIALSFLDGVRNGQELGTLLGYQFERDLVDRHNDPSLSQYIKYFRLKYPVMADKIPTEPNSETDETTEPKEARNIFDGYALLEAVYFQEPPPIDPPTTFYPYGIDKFGEVPAKNTPAADAIIAEVAHMAESLDAIADLGLAEGVYQVAQGNFERAGSMLKTMSQGESPPEPEIVQTPRSGVTITQRVALHLPIGGIAERWPGAVTARALMEPGLNAWLGNQLPGPNRITFCVSLAGGGWNEENLVRLVLKPIDLIYMIGDDLDGETRELESRIAFAFRRQEQNDSLDVKIDFKSKPNNSSSINLFALLPLLRALRRLVMGSRPLSATDYRLPSEITTDLKEDPNPQNVDLDRLEQRIETAWKSFKDAVKALGDALPPRDQDDKPDIRRADATKLRPALRKLSEFGMPDAFPLSAFGGSVEAKSILVHQALRIYPLVVKSLQAAEDAKLAGNASVSEPERVAHYRAAAHAIFGSNFNLIPAFNLKNKDELQAATEFRDANPPNNLTRFHQDHPFLVDEWLEGAARVQPGLNTFETVTLLAEGLVKSSLHPKPIQLPFRAEDHWLAVEYPETFEPVGEYVSILQILPGPEFEPSQLQSGLVIDEWVETIPSKSEVTGIAFHFDQPNSEPPQVCLLAVTPEITGTWTWEKFVNILQDTLARAKQRGVEPDHLEDTAYAQLLPALLASIASRPFATITADFVHETAQRFERSD